MFATKVLNFSYNTWVYLSSSVSLFYVIKIDNKISLRLGSNITRKNEPKTAQYKFATTFQPRDFHFLRCIITIGKLSAVVWQSYERTPHPLRKTPCNVITTLRSYRDVEELGYTSVGCLQFDISQYLVYTSPAY